MGRRLRVTGYPLQCQGISAAIRRKVVFPYATPSPQKNALSAILYVYYGCAGVARKLLYKHALACCKAGAWRFLPYATPSPQKNALSAILYVYYGCAGVARKLLYKHALACCKAGAKHFLPYAIPSPQENAPSAILCVSYGCAGVARSHHAIDKSIILLGINTLSRSG